VAALAPAPDRVRQAAALIAGLVSGGWLRDVAGLLVGAEPPADPDHTLDSLAAHHPRFATDVALVRRAGAALTPVLRGDLAGAEALLGDEGTELLRHFYRDAPASLFTNTLITRVTAALIAARATARPLRVLEVGGGTGGTTEHLRRVLPTDTEYVFTDISSAFTQAMAAPGVQTRVFDLERTLDEQAMPGGFDLVVAANVVHATADLPASLARLHDLLAPGGRLVLVEITRPLLWLDVVFGSSPGWWAYADDYRPNGALLEPDQWLQVLGDAGFVDAGVIADRPEDGPPGQCVLVAGRAVSVGAAPLEPIGRWAVTGEGSLADAIRGQLGTLDALADDDATGQIHIGGRLTGFLDVVRERTAVLPHGVWVITARGQAVGGDAPDPDQAALWGLVRVARKEYPDQPWRLVDVPAEPDPDDIRQLLEVVFTGARTDDGEDEIALRDRRLLVRRLRRIPTANAHRPAQPEEGWRADVERPGALDTLLPRPSNRRVPGPGEVEIRIDAASVNFRDVMLASGLLPAMASEGTFADRLLGLDLAGTVVACGPGVDDLTPGDAVFGIGPGTFASYTTTPAELVTRIPSGLDRESAAASPCAFVTAVYALERIAALQPGERVLIHAATGGVGLAALQVARAIGAEVLATAGSDEKRALLGELGVEHVFDSRSLDFADGVLAATGGDGVDVVLNSLSGPAIAAGLRCLAKYGRFVEIGKRDIYADASLELLPFRHNLSFSAVDLDLLCRERPALAGSMLRLVAARFTDGTYSALPMTTFPVQQTSAALRLVGQARHIGKVVINVSDTEVELDAPLPAAPHARPDGTYLVTGGTGGFGREVAGWLADHRAGAIVLMSRSGGDAATLDALRQRCAPTSITVVRGDISNEVDGRRVLDEIRRDQPPLRGVVHAAMALTDVPLVALTEDGLREAIRAKLDGVRLLDELTASDDLDFFVAFSSMASLLGNPQQGAYAAANAAMAAVIQRRRAAGRVGTVVDWGVLGAVGYVAQNPEVAAFLDRQGYLSFRPAQALAALAAALADGRPQLMAARIDWSRWAATASREAHTPRLAHFAPTSIGAGTNPALVNLDGLSPELRRDAVRERVRTIVASLLGISPARIDSDRTLFDLGFDSLIAVELTVRLQADFGVELAVLQLLKDMTIDGLADVVLRDAAAGSPTVALSPSPPMVEAPPAVTEPVIDRPTTTPAPRPSADIVRYSSLDYRRWTRGQRMIQRAVIAISAPLLAIDVEGADYLSTPGAFVLATNHLTLLDVPLVLAIMPRPAVIFAAPELRQHRLINWLLSDLGNAIYVDRGAGDVEAIEKGLAVLRAGGVLGLSPEGIRSPQLTRAKTGAARLSAGAGVPVVPLAIWGQDELARQWRHGGRAHVHIRVGEPIAPTGPSPRELITHTNEIMSQIAAMLPPRYRGAYADSVS
jgi:1-acyl-sn-glycerol-3-phosphate acyltransferase